MKRVLIIEDEEPSARRLERLLNEIDSQLLIVGHTQSIEESVDFLKAHDKIDIIFVDIQLSDGLSFEIFSQVQTKAFLIFVTAFDEYAIKAFKFNSIDYLLKPVDKEELITALRKVEHWGNEETVFRSESLVNLLNFVESTRSNTRMRFLLPSRNGYTAIRVEDIAYAHSEFKIVRFMLKDGKEQVVPYTMEELEKQLNPERFFRANRQFIVNIDSVNSIQNHYHSKFKVILPDYPNTEIIVSKERAPLFKAWLDR